MSHLRALVVSDHGSLEVRTTSADQSSLQLLPEQNLWRHTIGGCQDDYVLSGKIGGVWNPALPGSPAVPLRGSVIAVFDPSDDTHLNQIIEGMVGLRMRSIRHALTSALRSLE